MNKLKFYYSKLYNKNFLKFLLVTNFNKKITKYIKKFTNFIKVSIDGNFLKYLFSSTL